MAGASSRLDLFDSAGVDGFASVMSAIVLINVPRTRPLVGPLFCVLSTYVGLQGHPTTSSLLEPILTINGAAHRQDLDILNHGYHTGDLGMLRQKCGTCNLHHAKLEGWF